MITDNTKLDKYYLVDGNLRPNYAILKSVELTEMEARMKNYALRLHRKSKFYIKQKDW
jgi:hypothetical protein